MKGGFSTTDPVAQDLARRSCPRRPKGIVAFSLVGGARLVDEEATAPNVVCARVWGASFADVADALARSCKAPSCADSATQPKGPGECFHLETLVAWAKQVPLVLLQDPD